MRQKNRKFSALLSGVIIAAVSGTVFASVYSKKPLHTTNFKEILKSYTFVNDFSTKPPERSVSKEIFWKYPVTIPRLYFKINSDFDDPNIELPATRGGGMAVTHMNRGRLLYLKGDFESAKATWLSARARYGKNFHQHRRNDYFLGLSFLRLGESELKLKKGNWNDRSVRNRYSNASTFLSWAFIAKADNPDKMIDQITPKGLYNLAAIYWRFGRFSGAYGAATKGLDFLRKTGRTEYRAEFNRFLAEAFIKNRTYLEAVQYIDKAIRQDPDPKMAAAMFTRVGDIYYDLNNYELAEDAYALGARINLETDSINPAQMVLRGESLFWLGRFSEAQKVLNFALKGADLRDATSPLQKKMAAYATLRVADAYLARGKYEKAKLAYFNVIHEFKRSDAAVIARIRSACLELPFYNGNNVRHARELLEKMKLSNTVPRVAKEISWACQVSSYTDRERTGKMLERVTNFANTYPESKFLMSMATPVKEVQASRIMTLFKNGETYKAISFFEKNRSLLFDKISEDLGRKLFVAYTDVHLTGKASEFWKFRIKEHKLDLESLRQVVVSSEMFEKNGEKKWNKASKKYAKELDERVWKIQPSFTSKTYLQRILTTKDAGLHLPWIYNLSKHWSVKDNDYLCSHQYPHLSKIYSKGLKGDEFVRKEIDQMVAKTMPGLLRLDESCAISLLDLEAMLYKNDIKKLAKIYQTRKTWPLLGAFLKSYWTVSEKLKQLGHRKLARKLWETIKTKGPKGSPEVGFAIARLDPRKTEFEKLWDY
jgi:tetratricopeptide (TPR) repeat protein